MSDEAVKKRLQRAVRAAIRTFPPETGIEVQRIYHPYFHLCASLGNQKRWIRIVLDSSTATEIKKIKSQKEVGRKELWVRHRGDERFDMRFF